MSADNIEIERKFQVINVPDLTGATKSVIRQGYLTLPSDSVEIRLRQKDDLHFLTFKSDGGAVRTERELEVAQAQFETLWPETLGRRVEKDRWTGALDGGLRYELDLFGGPLDGLVLVEVEFDSEPAARAFTPPDWFGVDVTEDKRFKNKALALNGRPG